MLSETTAWSLFQQHCNPLSSAEWVRVDFYHRSEWVNCALDHVDLIVQSRTAKPEARRGATTGRDVGAQMRLALGVAQAVSCCRGFEPATNQAFWRRVVQTLWSPPSEDTPTHACAFSPKTFTHVGIEWNAQTPNDYSFWMGFFHGTPDCDAAMASVLTTLRPHLCGGPLPPLRVSLSHCRSGRAPPMWSDDQELDRSIQWESVVTPDALKMMLRAATPMEGRRTRSMATHLGLVVEYRVDDNPYSAHETLDLLGQVRTSTTRRLEFTIDRLTIQLAPLVAPRSAAPGLRNVRALVNRVRPLGSLLRKLLMNDNRSAPRVNSVALLECSLSDYRLVGATLSAVALSSPPVQELRCSGLFDATLCQDQLMRLAWLAYTRHRREGPPLTLSLVASGALITTEEREYMEQLVTNGMPLRDVVGEALRLRLGGDDDKVVQLNVECLPCGCTVQLASGTRLYVEPMRVRDEFVVVTLDATVGDGGDDGGGEVVDVVAHVTTKGGFVGVVYGGFGLVWADEAYVVAWHLLDRDVVMTEDEEIDCRGDTGQVSLTSLELKFNSALVDLPFDRFPFIHRTSTMLPFFACETLETLALDRAVITHDDLAHVLESFPRIHTLTLDRCVIESLAPLADAYRSSAVGPRRARVAVLSLLDVRDLSMRDEAMTVGPVLRTGHSIHSEVDENEDHRAVAWLLPLLDVLSDGVADGVLHELHIDLMGMREADEHVVVGRLAHALTASMPSLARLHVGCRSDLLTECERSLGPLRDAVLSDPPRVRRAVLSVLRVFGCAASEIARIVLKQSEGGVVRTITWNCD